MIDFSAIIENLRETKLGKSAGIDGLAAEHFSFTRTVAHLALLFTCVLKLLNHGHVPTAFMKTSIFSDLKNRIGDSSDMNNYRPIAIVTAMCKLFKLYLSKLQAAFLYIKYYNYFSSPSNNWALLKKLLIRSMPIFFFVRILCLSYLCQQLCIQIPRSSLYRMVYGRAGFYLLNYFLSSWMINLTCLFIVAFVDMLIMCVSISCNSVTMLEVRIAYSRKSTYIYTHNKLNIMSYNSACIELLRSLLFTLYIHGLCASRRAELARVRCEILVQIKASEIC